MEDYCNNVQCFLVHKANSDSTQQRGPYSESYTNEEHKNQNSESRLFTDTHRCTNEYIQRTKFNRKNLMRYVPWEASKHLFNNPQLSISWCGSKNTKLLMLSLFSATCERVYMLFQLQIDKKK